jgi:hypothetical protein
MRPWNMDPRGPGFFLLENVGGIWISWFSTVWNVFPKMVWIAACFYLLCFAQSSLLSQIRRWDMEVALHLPTKSNLLEAGRRLGCEEETSKIFLLFGYLFEWWANQNDSLQKQKVKLGRHPLMKQSPKPETRGGWARLFCTKRKP